MGEKARGLLGLPPAWVPPFFVLGPEFHAAFLACEQENRERLVRSWTSVVEDGIRVAGLDGVSKLYLRSNAVEEAIAQRGQFRSAHCERPDWHDALVAVLSHPASSGHSLAVIVQEYVKPILSGHLSNERRVVNEYRDARIEIIDEASGAMTEASLSFRRWRKSRRANPDALVCTGADDLNSVLREPLALAASEKLRTHFEWIWDGRVVYIVQADPARDAVGGVSPDKLVAGTSPAVELAGLRVFHRAEKSDAKDSKKLSSHFLYEENGFKQPALYVMTDERVLLEAMNGRVDPGLRSDLEALTQRPLVIRTSASATSGTMLPRSDVLKSAEQAAEWLTGAFAREMSQRGADARGLMLIAHHFIPAKAAAFASAAPHDREVYIEALWGIPEGLYYYPCDAYLVDTQSASPDNLPLESFTVLRDIRFKGAFVAPDTEGKFVVHPTKLPWDWKSTLGDTSDVPGTIAAFTRKLAGILDKPVKVMWFIECSPSAGLPTLLPWYHDSDASWKTEGFRYTRNSRDEGFDLQTYNDLERLEARAASGDKPGGARRLVVTLDPAEDRIIRNEDVATRVGEAAKKLGAIVELRGGILSHVYYALKRTGADIAVRNRPSFSQPPQEFRKLVRDNIPSVVAAGGESARITRLSPEAFKSALKIKLVEEAFEARDAKPSELILELADVLEVVDALRESAGISKRALEETRRKKNERRGGFSQGILLLDTSFPEDDEPEAPTIDGLERAPGTGVIETTEAVRLEDARPGPFDIRESADFVEFVQSANIGLTRTEWVVHSPARIRMRTKVSPDSIEWSIEGRREGGQLKLRLKIRVGSRQFELPLETIDGA